MPQRNLVILLVALAASYACYVRGEQNPFARYLSGSFDAIESTALERVPNEELFDRALEAMVGVLNKHGDQHSQFIPSTEADPFQAEMRQEFGGIGVRIRLLGDPPQLLIVGDPDPGTPAARAGIRANDQVLEIDGTPTVGLDMNDVLRLMRGQPGEPLKLLVRHVDADQPEAKQLVREVISVDSILGDRRSGEGGWEYRLEADPRIAQVRVTTFGNKTADELERVLTTLTDEGVEAVVLDLRDDSGGSLDAAVEICNMFLPEGKTIVEILGRDDVLDERRVSDGEGLFTKIPLAVLVNAGSASASEIVAACLQDNGRARVFGERSYGKGTVQQLIEIESGRSLLKLTTARYVRPNGKNIHRTADAKEDAEWGVSPDEGHEVPLTADEYRDFTRYRSLRDLWGEPPPAELLAAEEAKLDGDDIPSQTTNRGDFVDRPLTTAVEYLQRKLDRDQANSA